MKSDHCDAWGKKTSLQSPTDEQLCVHAKNWQLKAGKPQVQCLVGYRYVYVLKQVIEFVNLLC